MNILKYDTKYTMHIDQSGLANAIISIINSIEEKNITIVSNDEHLCIYAKDGTNDKLLYYKEMIEFHLNINCIDYEES
jgi:hypothetical protein